MSVVLSTAMERAQHALNGGDYRGAAETCNRIVAQFPTFAAAYRLLGEAQLEQGRATDAERAFAQVLTRDPRQPEAYLGMGLIAEERGVLESSLAYCQVAWELAPQQPQFREPVVRVASRRYGGDGHLQLTHAALAQLHLNASRLHRAAAEYQRALVELPDRVDLWLGLATAFWRLGRDDDAGEIAHEFLKEQPELGQALVMAADVEHRRGNATTAQGLLDRLRRVDADGSLVAEMVAANPHADAAFLLLAPDAVPVLEERAETVAAELPQIAPAPDFNYQPPAPKAPDLGAAAVAGAAAGIAAGLSRRAEPDPEADLVLDAELAALTPMSAEEFGGDPETLSFSLDDTSVEPFALDDFILPEDVDAQLNDGTEEVAAWPAAGGLSAESEIAADEFDMSDLAAAFDDLEPVSIEELGGFADAELEIDQLTAEQPADMAAAAADEDELGELARALETDVAGALVRAGEPLEVGGSLAADASDVAAVAGFTTLLSELGDEGLTPFDPSRASAAALDDDGSDADADDLGKLTEGWDDLDATIASAVPTTTGQTDELVALSGLDVEPFSLDEYGTDALGGFVPSAGLAPHLPPAVPVEAPEPIEASVGDLPEQAAELDAYAAPFSPEEAFLSGIEPFSSDEFDDLAGGDFSFGKLPWETNADDSALPSDADLDAMLADSSLPTVEDTDLPLVERDALTSALETGEIEDLITSEPSALQPAANAEPLPVFDMPDIGKDDDLDASLAVTRELGTLGPVDDDFELRLAAMEAAAALSLEQLHSSHAESAEELADKLGEPPAKPVSATDLFPKADAGKLAGDKGIFDRSRAAKDELVFEGVIVGDLELAATWPAAGDVAPAPAEVLVEPAPPAQVGAAVQSPSRDIDTLRLSLEAAPDDDELHWWLAEALRDGGEPREALTEYRWLIRHAPARHEQVTAALLLCVEHQQEPELAHRLLSDAYRRRGDNAKASSHAAQAMAERRKHR